VVPALANLGYDPSNAVRTAITYMGLNPDHMLVRPEPAPPEPGMPAEGGMPPEEGMAPLDPMAGGDVMGQEPVPSAEALAILTEGEEGGMGDMSGLPPELQELLASGDPAILEQLLGGGMGGMMPEEPTPSPEALAILEEEM